MPVTTFDIDRERRELDVSREIARYLPNANPFTVILMRARKRAANDPELIWYDEEPYGYWAQVNNATGYTATDTNIVVNDASLFAPDDVVRVPATGEVMLVTARNTQTNTITVQRGFAGSTAQALPNATWLVVIGNAMPERSRAPLEKIKQPSKHFNYVQVFRTPFGESGTSQASKKRTSEDERTRLRRSKSIDHRLSLERAMLFGKRSEDATGKRRTTGGLMEFVQTNVYAFKTDLSDLTEAAFEESLENPFQAGNGRKLLVASPRFLTVITRFAREKLRTEVGQETYGVRMITYLSGHGELRIVPSRTFEKYYQGWAVLVDMDYVWYRPLRDTVLKTNIQENDEDGWTDEYFTEAGLQVELEKAHAVYKAINP